MEDVQLKSNEQIDKMRAADLKTYAKEISNCFRELNTRLFDKDTGVIVKLQQQLEVSQAINKSLIRQLSKVEETAISNAQYARRDTLELHGVPASFGDGEELDGKVMDLLKDIAPGAGVQPKEIQAIHRLKNRKNVIVKFVNRKTRHAVIIKKKQLSDDAVKRRHKFEGDMWLNESMCFPVKHLYYLCKMLKQGNHIEHYSFFNGSIRVKMEKDGEQTMIRHINDLAKLTGLDRSTIEDLAK